MAALKTTAVPYRGTSQSVTDLVAGRVDFTIDNLGPMLPFIKSGHLIALGVSTKEAVEVLPNVPPINSVLKDYELSPWTALVMPAKTPDEIIHLIARECDRIVHLPDVADKIRELGSDPVGGSPEQLATFLKAERPKWAAAIKAANIPKQ
jgi:tripartite-type tricarboxylate transporter receptor subunit TctC